MPHFAHINENDIVDSVICITPETLEIEGGWFVDGVKKPKEEWVQTSYNAKGGMFNGMLDGTVEDIKARQRKNFAGVGFTYDRVNDAFVPPKPISYPSWVLNKKTYLWEPPTDKPKDKLTEGQFYSWNEEKVTWEIITR